MVTLGAHKWRSCWPKRPAPQTRCKPPAATRKWLRRRGARGGAAHVAARRTWLRRRQRGVGTGAALPRGRWGRPVAGTGDCTGGARRAGAGASQEVGAWVAPRLLRPLYGRLRGRDEGGGRGRGGRDGGGGGSDAVAKAPARKTRPRARRGGRTAARRCRRDGWYRCCARCFQRQRRRHRVGRGD